MTTYALHPLIPERIFYCHETSSADHPRMDENAP
jgi:hypothetical protein